MTENINDETLHNEIAHFFDGTTNADKSDEEKLHDAVLYLLDKTKNIVRVQHILTNYLNIPYDKIEENISNVLLKHGQMAQYKRRMPTSNRFNIIDGKVMDQ
jgi:hypothetical protein